MEKKRDEVIRNVEFHGAMRLIEKGISPTHTSEAEIQYCHDFCEAFEKAREAVLREKNI